MNSFQTKIDKIDITKENKERYLALREYLINVSNLDVLNNYYLEKKRRADQLVTDDEFVGYTYHNLNVIEQVISGATNDKKLMKHKKINLS